VRTILQVLKKLIGNTTATTVGELLPELLEYSDQKRSNDVAGWLAEHITQPTTPVIDTSLSVSGAAADSKVVGDTLATGVMLRGTLAANTDMDTIIQSGMYYKGKNVTLVNAPPDSSANRARIIVFGSNSDTSVTQLWINTYDNKVWHRTRETNVYSWKAWERLTDDSESFSVRSTLEANTDMDTVLKQGIYVKSNNVSLVNSPSNSAAARARVVVFGDGGGVTVVQVWFDTSRGQTQIRMKSGASSAWSEWTKLVTPSDVETALESALTLRPSIVADTDMDTVIQPGMYYKAKNVSLVNAPSDSSRRARIVVFSGGGETSVAQLWFDTYDNKVWHRMKESELNSWSEWEEAADSSEALMLRSSLEADTDMDTIIQPGMYYKAKNVSLVNAPSDSTTRARIVVFSGGGETSVVHLWCVTDINKIWHRMKSAASSSWSAWVCDADAFSGGDRYPGSVFSRTVDVYTALDELEDSSGGRITHTAITDSLDSTDLPEGETADDNRMRLYKIDTTPSHMVSGGYTISNTPLYQKPKALIIACQHGDEKASASYVVDFVKRLLTDPELNSVASAVEWHIVPVVNVWGFNHNTRNNAPTAGNASGYNINRDYSDTPYTYGESNPQTYGFQTVEAQAIKQLYLDNVYVFFLDVHQAGSSGGCGFASVPNQVSNRLSDYEKLWRAIDKAGRTAQIWMQNDPNTVKANDQITFNWGNPSDPPIGSNTTASAPAYIRGNPYWNAHVAEQNPVFCAGTIETQKRCTKISGSNIDYNYVAMCFGAVYMQAIIKELVETVLTLN
jgi:hypothetical protein